MTDKDLIKANKLKKEIDELELFIWEAERVWTGKIIKTKYIFKSNGYGAFGSAEFNMNTAIKDRVLDVLRTYLNDLKKQLTDI